MYIVPLKVTIEDDDLTELKQRGILYTEAQTKNKILQSIEWSLLLGNKYFIFSLVDVITLDAV